MRRFRPRSPGRLGNTRLTPVVIAIIVINVAVFIWEETRFTNIVDRFALWPYGVHYLGQWYRLITAAFLHANIEHIAFNMITLAIVGPPVEAELGSVDFTALYLASAVGGSVCSYLVSPMNVLGLGASGAIFGIMGAYFVLARRRRWDTSTILALIGINLIISFTSSGIDWRAHIGGLVTGALVALGMSVFAERRLPGWSNQMRVAAGVSTAVVAVGVLALLATLPPGHVNM